VAYMAVDAGDRLQPNRWQMTTSDQVRKILLAAGVKPGSVSPYITAWTWAESGKASTGLSKATVDTYETDAARVYRLLSEPQISNTRDKLREATFFFEQIAWHEGRMKKEPPDASRYYLSAFLSAARSVSFYLRKELKARYEAWFPAWMESLTDDERDLLQHHNQQRVLAVHVSGPEISSTVTTEPLGQSGDRFDHPELGAGFIFSTSSVPNTGGVTISRLTHHFGESPADDVTVSCERYLALLTRLLSDFTMYWSDRPQPGDE
jgi:hypothetical protein